MSNTLIDILVCIISIVWMVGVLKWDVRTDLKKWKERKPIEHTPEFIIRLLLLSPSIIGLSYLLPVPWVWAIAISGFLEGSWYFMFFDGLYNIKRKKNWWFTGSDDPDDAKTDNFLQTLTLAQHKVLKFSLIAVSTALYLIFLL